MYLPTMYVYGYKKTKLDLDVIRGGSGGGGGRTRRVPPPPPKIGKNMIFWRKIVIFHTKYPKNFRASLRICKKYDFLA